MIQRSLSPHTTLPLKFITAKDLIVTSTVSVLYLLLSKLLIGFKTEQLVLVFLFNALYYLSVPTRKFITGFSIFIVYWIIFDYMKAFPNYRYNTVHIQSLFDAEKYLFGIHTEAGVITANEYWLLHSQTFLNILTGFFYLCWIPIPLAFAVYLFYTKREQFLGFSFTFLVVNLVGFVIYYTYPAAPPWYIEQYGNVFHAATPSSTAGLHRFDQYFGANIFQSLYSKGSNVFAAMPSLHSSYPIIVFYYALRNRLKVLSVLAAIIMFGIFFSAIYNTHHYILDVIAGILTALTGIFLFNKLLEHNRPFRCFFEGIRERIQ